MSDTVKAALLTESIDADRERYPDDLMCGHYLGYLENRPEEVVARCAPSRPHRAPLSCTAPRARTGLASSSRSRSLSPTSPEAIIEDYMATDERLEAIVERLSRSRMYAGDVTSRPVKAHAPRAETMKAFLEQLTVRYGGVDAWLTANGFGEAEVAALRAKLRQA